MEVCLSLKNPTLEAKINSPECCRHVPEAAIHERLGAFLWLHKSGKVRQKLGTLCFFFREGVGTGDRRWPLDYH